MFPQTQVQTCIVHLIRNLLDFVSYKDRKAVAAALKQIYRAKDAVPGIFGPMGLRRRRSVLPLRRRLCLVSDFCSSGRDFAPRFLQTVPHGSALALR